MDKKEILKNIIINRGRTLYHKFRSQKTWHEMSLWEKRMYAGKDGKPVPIHSFMGGDLPSHEEGEQTLEKALHLGIRSKFFSFLSK